MLKDMIIVQTAASAFNNIALWAPAFIWWAILALPIFFWVRICSDVIMTRIGWTHQNIIERATTLTIILATAWTIMFGGNYDVLRDGVSILPWMIASILFVGTIFITSHTWLPTNMSRTRKITLGILILVGAALSGAPTWWGPLLQMGAIISGALVGRTARYPMRPMSGTILIILTITTAIMMQPEFFRFGKLGELTFLHMTFILMTGISAVATLALNNVRPHGRIHHSAYIKLKWMLRFVAALAVALMFMTESVPVFLGTLAVFFVMFALSIWHASDIDIDMPTRTLAITIGLFGIITTMPAIVAIAVLIWTTLPPVKTWEKIRHLL